MTDKPEAWWRAPPEHAEQVEQNRQAFMEQFGDFAEAANNGFWLGSSPDGQYLGLQFDRPDGSVVRVSVRWWDVEGFFTELAGAMEYMGQRQFALKAPEGAA
ncbi:MAG: hypothetical protein EOR67_16150 [Mesorhizobium sp.]|uniref:hypothetical protein n=1 Tax=Mesorhizobium sp. TaxID=1871066 RepID=UPI000FE69FFE|nr:hypothetical protein [Mesorhizobium sp.]RWL87729.1 MAG: hypothetical protein EOR67_16150 [Mesorhizobium sp.]